MIEFEHFERLWNHDKTNFIISIIVAIFTIYKDPIIGPLIGAFLSLILLVQKLSNGYHEIVSIDADINEAISEEKIIKDKTIIYYIKGKLTNINSQAHITHFETKLSEYDLIIISFRDTYFIDIDGSDAFDDIIDIILKRNQKIRVIDLDPKIKSFLKQTSKHFNKL